MGGGHRGIVRLREACIQHRSASRNRYTSAFPLSIPVFSLFVAVLCLCACGSGIQVVSLAPLRAYGSRPRATHGILVGIIHKLHAFSLSFNVMRSQAVSTPYRKWVAYARITNDVIDIDCTTCFRVPLQASNQPPSREKVSWLLVHHPFGSSSADKTFYRKSMLKLKRNFGMFSYPSGLGR